MFLLRAGDYSYALGLATGSRWRSRLQAAQLACANWFELPQDDFASFRPPVGCGIRCKIPARALRHFEFIALCESYQLSHQGLSWWAGCRILAQTLNQTHRLGSVERLRPYFLRSAHVSQMSACPLADRVEPSRVLIRRTGPQTGGWMPVRGWTRRTPLLPLSRPAPGRQWPPPALQ